MTSGKAPAPDRALGAPYPGALLYSLDGGSIRRVEYQETEHFRITRDFLNAPERYYKHLFRESAPEPPDR